MASYRLFKRILFLTTLIFALFYIYSNFLEARPGGGHSSRSRSSGGGSSRSSSGGSSRSSGGGYSGGSSRSSGGSYSGTPMTAQDFFILLAIIGVILVIVVVVNANQNKTTTVYVDNDSDQADYARLRNQAKYQLELLRSADTNFSEMLFLDYVQLIFHTYYTEQGKPALKNLSPYFMNAVTGSRSMLQYKEIVINAMNIVGASNNSAGTEITVLIEANYTQVDASGKGKRFLVEQEWTFFRQGGVQSLPPAKMQVLACPACGAPDSFAGDTKCNACGTDITPSISQWAVMATKTLYSDAYESDNLVSYEQEMGTNDATVFDTNLNQQLHNFSLAHQISNLNEYLENFKSQLVIPTFKAIYTAWTNKTWNKTRHLVSDFLYETQNFWMQEYKNKGYTNHLKNIEVSQVQIAKVDKDAFYESVTVRIFASCLDYTTDSKGSKIGGDKDTPRQFSEYWTFIRRAGVETQKKDEWAIFANCPACAAPLDKIGMSGECGYCSNKISTGEFSWVLSRITQDEAYF